VPGSLTVPRSSRASATALPRGAALLPRHVRSALSGAPPPSALRCRLSHRHVYSSRVTSQQWRPQRPPHRPKSHAPPPRLARGWARRLRAPAGHRCHAGRSKRFPRRALGGDVCYRWSRAHLTDAANSAPSTIFPRQFLLIIAASFPSPPSHCGRRHPDGQRGPAPRHHVRRSVAEAAAVAAVTPSVTPWHGSQAATTLRTGAGPTVKSRARILVFRGTLTLHRYGVRPLFSKARHGMPCRALENRGCRLQAIFGRGLLSFRRAGREAPSVTHQLGSSSRACARPSWFLNGTGRAVSRAHDTRFSQCTGGVRVRPRTKGVSRALRRIFEIEISLLKNESKPSNDGLTKRVCFIGATCLYSLIGPRTTPLSM